MPTPDANAMNSCFSRGIGQMVSEISHSMVFKMATICHLGFLKVLIFEYPFRLDELMCVTVQNFIKIGQTVLQIS